MSNFKEYFILPVLLDFHLQSTCWSRSLAAF